MTTPPDTQRLIIDRFENELAILETEQGDLITIPRHKLPPTASEGDIIQRIQDKTTRYILLPDATAAAKAEAAARLERLKTRDPSGDIDL